MSTLPINPSESTRRRNPNLWSEKVIAAAGRYVGETMANRMLERKRAIPIGGLIVPLTIQIPLQVIGGKNNMKVSKSGHHYPSQKWAQWRDKVVAIVQSQLPAGFVPISQPVNVHLDYVAGDKRRRDMPAILDSIFHVLERAGVVADDGLIWVTQSTRTYNPSFPGAIMTFHDQH